MKNHDFGVSGKEKEKKERPRLSINGMPWQMARPEEVLIVQDENDPESIIQEVMKDTDAIMLYKSMRETLIYLTNLDVEDTEHIMRRTLAKQVDGSEWKWETLNTLCPLLFLGGTFPSKIVRGTGDKSRKIINFH